MDNQARARLLQWKCCCRTGRTRQRRPRGDLYILRDKLRTNRVAPGELKRRWAGAQEACLWPASRQYDVGVMPEAGEVTGRSNHRPVYV